VVSLALSGFHTRPPDYVTTAWLQLDGCVGGAGAVFQISRDMPRNRHRGVDIGFDSFSRTLKYTRP